MAIPDELLAAYEATHFVVFDQGEEWVVKVGEASTRFDLLLERYGVSHAVVVTAFNPRSVPLSAAENGARHAELVRILQAEGVRFLLGEGRDPGGDWIAETECILLGVSTARALELARWFDQNAVLSIGHGRAPRLELLT